MEAQLAVVRNALQALYSAHDGSTRKAADNWLQNFRNSSGSWQLCLTLLARPGLVDYEYHFAAQSLRLACCKVPELLDPNVLQGLAVQLATLLLASVGGGAWPVAGQLSSALAALAVRAVCWEAEALVPQLLSLLSPQVAAAMLADLALGSANLGIAVVGGTHVDGSAVLVASVGAEATAVFALLQVVTSLPEACGARAVSAHPQRKAQVAAALAADATVVPLLRATVVGSRALDAAAAAAAAALPVGVQVPLHLNMGSGLGALGLAPASVAAALAGGGGGGVAAANGLQGSALRRAGLQLLHAWAEQLGTAPRGLEHEAELIGCLYEALATADTAALAAECLCGLFATCCSHARDGPDDGYQSDTSSSSSGMVVAEAVVPVGQSAGSSRRRGNWGEAAGFRKPRQGVGGNGGGGGGARGGGSSARMAGGGGAAAAAKSAATAAITNSPERQLASALLLQRLLDGLQALLQGAAMVYREQQQQVVLMSGRAGVAPPATCALPSERSPDSAFWSSWSDGAVLQALCNVLCSAAAAVIPGALRGDTALQARFNALWPQLMALLGHNNPEVALSCVSFWQDTYLAQLMQACAPLGLGQSSGQQDTRNQGVAVLHSHLPLLAQLLTGLVSRAALGSAAAAVATADARDLPEEVRMVRRELGATMRDLVGLVGLGHVAAFLERMVSEHAAQLGAAGRDGSTSAAAAAGASPPGPPALWTRLESSLYAANVALCSGGGGGGSSGAGGGRAAFGTGTDGAAAVQAASGVGLPVDDAHIASIISTASAAVVHPASSLKLAGTALTLVGGMAAWFSEHPQELARPLEAVRAALASPDEKLARNAATALNRLCVHSGCAVLLLGQYSGWVSGLRALLPGPEVTLRHKPAPGVDMTSRELLVASLMRLACGSDSGLCLAPPQQPQVPPQQLPNAQQRQVMTLSRESSRDLDTSSAAGANTGGASGGGGTVGVPLTSQHLLHLLLAPRVLAAVSELQRLAAALNGAASSGGLQAHLQLWRLGRQQQQQQHAQQHSQQHMNMSDTSTALHTHPVLQLQQLQHCQQHCPQPCHHHHHHYHEQAHMPAHGRVYGAGDQRASLCQAGAPQELQQLGAIAMVAAQRLGGLASMLLFVPAAGQVQDMGAGGLGGRRGATDTTRGPPAAAEAAASSTSTEASAAAAAVLSLVVQVVRAVWPNLMACLRPAAVSSGGPDGGGGANLAAGGATAQLAGGAEGGSLLLQTCEGAHLLPAACSLLQGALLVAAAQWGPSAAGGFSAAAANTAPAAELLSCSICLLGLSHDVQPVPPTDQQLQQQQWPANLDWPVEAGASPGGTGGATGTRGAHLASGHSQPHQPQQYNVRPLWHGPPVCILQLVLGCLPLCAKILTLQPTALNQHVPADGQAAAVVAEQAIQAACVVARSACACLRLPARSVRSSGVLSGYGPTSSLDTDRVLHVLPVFQSLLLHTPHALASSRELLECLVAATVSCMHCHDPEAGRAVLDWTQLLLSTTAFATPPGPPAAGLPAVPIGQQGRGGGPVGTGVSNGAAAASGGGLASLQARVNQAPALERAYAGIAAQLDATCACCAPNAEGLAYTAAAVESGMVTSDALGFVSAIGQMGLRPLLQQPQAAAVGSLCAVLVLSLMAAAAGGMPPDLMLPISTCLHGAWRAMGGARFRVWVRTAAVDLSSSVAAAAMSGGGGASGMPMPHVGHHLGHGGGAAGCSAMPWSRLKPESLLACLIELWSEESERDVMKFKRSLKALCGGKKKGMGGG